MGRIAAARGRFSLPPLVKAQLALAHLEDGARVVGRDSVRRGVDVHRLVELAKVGAAAEIHQQGRRQQRGCYAGDWGQQAAGVGIHGELELHAVQVELRFVDPEIERSLEAARMIDQAIEILASQQVAELGIAREQLTQALSVEGGADMAQALAIEGLVPVVRDATV